MLFIGYVALGLMCILGLFIVVLMFLCSVIDKIDTLLKLPKILRKLREILVKYPMLCFIISAVILISVVTVIIESESIMNWLRINFEWKNTTSIPTTSPTSTPQPKSTLKPVPTPSPAPTSIPIPTLQPKSTLKPVPVPKSSPVSVAPTSTPIPTPQPTSVPALESTYKYPMWVSGKGYTEGDKVMYKNKIYKCNIPHTSIIGSPPPDLNDDDDDNKYWLEGDE